MKFFSQGAFLFFTLSFALQVSAQLIPAGYYQYSYGLVLGGKPVGSGGTDAVTFGRAGIGDNVASHRMQASGGGRVETDMDIPFGEKSAGTGFVRADSRLVYEIKIAGPVTETTVPVDIAGLISLSIASGFSQTVADYTGSRVVLLSNFRPGDGFFSSSQIIAQRGLLGLSGNRSTTPVGPGEDQFLKTFNLIPNTSYGILIESGLWFDQIPPEGISAKAMADPDVSISKDFLNQHPDYSLVFTAGFGPSAVPEPSSYAGVATALIVAAVGIRRASRKKQIKA